MSTDGSHSVPSGGPESTDRGPALPRAFGHYTLLEELGRGAQGVVFLAEDNDLRRKVALKMLTGAGAQSQITRDRFRREAELTSRFEHPGICGVHDVGEAEGLPYIAMQYVRGTTLATLVEKARTGSEAAGRPPGPGSTTITIAGGGNKGGLEDVLRLVERAARALHVAHEAGLVHRDIKPANIMVTPEGHPVLLDFGLARDLDGEGQTLTQSGQIMGTPAYLAPEQIVPARGKVDRRTDVYALGVTLFECLTLKRPFESTSWDQLFHEILDGAPRNPRKLNPRIPEDLRIVIEEAMDREPERRYQTAEAFAEDLRRVRSFEPILAQDDGPLLRLRKWSIRNPGRAASAGAGFLFVLLGSGYFGWKAVERARAFRAHVAEAEAAIAGADPVAAAIAVSKAQELDPDSAGLRDLAARVERSQAEVQRAADRQAALEGAAAARDEANALGLRYQETRGRIEELDQWIQKEQSGVLGKHASDGARAAFARRERELRGLQVDAERLLITRSEALERAARLEDPWGGASEATQDALADFYLERWREALARRDLVRAEAMRAATERHDPRGRLRDELLGRGSLTVDVVPASSEVYLFRFEDRSALREEDVIPRLVPVPTAGVGRVREAVFDHAFRPGDPCVVVQSVEPASIASRAGVQEGDLVLTVGGLPAAGAVCVRSSARGSALERAGIPPLARVVDVDGHAVRNVFDWNMRMSRREGPKPRVRCEGLPEPVECRIEDATVASALDLLDRGTDRPVRVVGLRAGHAFEFELPAGKGAGITGEVTASPLVLASLNRVSPAAPIAADPGSYLLFARLGGFEAQRVAVVVERGAAVTARVELHPAGTTPTGFVFVPPGPFPSGGDAAAFRPRERTTVEVPGFFLARTELTNREWYEFVNDPAIAARIAARGPGEHLYLPQDDRVMAKRDASDAGYTWDVFEGTTADSPVLGITWPDARDYLAWRNARAVERGEAWIYDLPSASEWEKAARGVDGRLFPWGNRFDPSLTVCLVRQDGYLLDAPSGYEPCDESPYGVRDLAGSREEWLRDRAGDAEPPRYQKRGGHWGSSVEILFRSASHAEASQDRYAASQGVRLVARRR